jgi:hypothetical protein
MRASTMSYADAHRLCRREKIASNRRNATKRRRLLDQAKRELADALLALLPKRGRPRKPVVRRRPQ